MIAEKQCFKCLVVLPLSGFYKHPQMADGHVNKCKECNKKDVSERYDITRPDRAAYEKKRQADPERRKKKVEYKWQHDLRNPEKAHARTAVAHAIKSGKLVRQPCVHCGDLKVQAHHTDYSKPLDVVWVCFPCHRQIEHGQEVIDKAFRQTKTDA